MFFPSGTNTPKNILPNSNNNNLNRAGSPVPTSSTMTIRPGLPLHPITIHRVVYTPTVDSPRLAFPPNYSPRGTLKPAVLENALRNLHQMKENLEVYEKALFYVKNTLTSAVNNWNGITLATDFNRAYQRDHYADPVKGIRNLVLELKALSVHWNAYKHVEGFKNAYKIEVKPAIDLLEAEILCTRRMELFYYLEELARGKTPGVLEKTESYVVAKKELESIDYDSPFDNAWLNELKIILNTNRTPSTALAPTRVPLDDDFVAVRFLEEVV